MAAPLENIYPRSKKKLKENNLNFR